MSQQKTPNKVAKVYKSTALAFLIVELAALGVWIYFNFIAYKGLFHPKDTASTTRTNYKEFTLYSIGIFAYIGCFIALTRDIIRKIKQAIPVKNLAVRLVLIFALMVIPAMIESTVLVVLFF
jgi:hypothetical protein